MSSRERERYRSKIKKIRGRKRKEGRRLGVDPLKRKRNGGKSWRGCNSSRGNKSAQIKASRGEKKTRKRTKLRSGEIKNFAVVVQTRHNQPSAFTSSNVSKEHCSLGETNELPLSSIKLIIFVHSTVIKGGGRSLISITIEHVYVYRERERIMHVSFDADAFQNHSRDPDSEFSSLTSVE